MKATRVLSLALALSLCACASTNGGSRDAHGAGAKHFERMKSLEGHWVSAAPAPADSGGGMLAVDYHVVAAGSALEERLFPGTPHEMVTMYHLDGDELVLTHYCAMGNQPRMRAAENPDGSLTFTCFGGSNYDCRIDPHMHQGVFTIIDRDHLRTSWTSVNTNEDPPGITFELVRANR